MNVLQSVIKSFIHLRKRYIRSLPKIIYTEKNF